MRKILGTITWSVFMMGAAGALYANSGSLAAAPAPPMKRSGVPADGGLTCAACHASLGPANSDTRGKLRISSPSYQPGVKQKIRVELEHSTARRWGFQLTARLASDETKMAGSFTPDESVQVRCDDGQLRGVPAPCAPGLLQFASHTAASTRPGTERGVFWEIEWTPPDTDAGDIVFYAAGNASDFSGNNTGDAIYTAVRRVSGPCSLTGRPAITGVGNAASFVTGQIATNALVTITGVNFLARGVRRFLHPGDFADGLFPKKMSCLAVEINGLRAPLLYADNGQINVQVPTITALGPVAVRVLGNPGRANELRSDAATVTMVNYAPGLFLFPGTNSIAAHLPDGSAYIGPSSVAPGARAARPGEIITIYGTGFNATEPFYQAGEIVPPDERARIRDRFTVLVGGAALAASDILYAGLAPGAISGLYQFNIRLPASISDGEVPIVVEIGGQRSQSNATIPVRR